MSRPPTRAGIVTPTFSRLAELLPDQQVQLQLQTRRRPKQILASAGFKMGSDGHHGQFEGPEALLLRHQHRRLLRLGRLDAGGRPETSRRVGIQVTPEQPEQHRLHRLPLHGQVPARLLRPADLRPEARTTSCGTGWTRAGHPRPSARRRRPTTRRYSNPATDKLFSQYAARPPRWRSRHQIIGQVEQVHADRTCPSSPVGPGR